MDPFLSQSNYVYGVPLMPALIFSDNSMDDYLNGLNSSDYEAVMRMKDTFHSREEVERFVNGLHD